MASASHISPSSSPRLPSPPPIAEDQITSPLLRASDDIAHVGTSTGVDQVASRRIRPGSRAADMAEGPPLVDMKEINTPFQLTEHLKALHNYYTHPETLPTTCPIDHDIALRLAQAPEGIDRALWLYELCRFLVQKVNIIIVALFQDLPPCSSQTCPEMRASEWQYLCAVHDPPKSCCAIDYCCHTLDWAATTLSSPKHFPSRLALGMEAGSAQNQVRQLTNIFRRVYRIFAHAWFQHRDIFWRVEARTGLYMLFKTVCDAYNLIPEDNYTIPPEAEGLESANATNEIPRSPPSSLKREDSAQVNNLSLSVSDQTQSIAVQSSTTRRHRQNPSKGSFSVTTVIEENEEEDDTEAISSPKDEMDETQADPSLSTDDRSIDETVISLPEAAVIVEDAMHNIPLIDAKSKTQNVEPSLEDTPSTGIGTNEKVEEIKTDDNIVVHARTVSPTLPSST